MNLHVTNDNYGFYTLVIAKRIKVERSNNLIINFYQSPQFRDDCITYLSYSRSSFQNYLDHVENIDKLIFHPYQYNSYLFLKFVKRKFPNVKVYWVIWSSELYCFPPLPTNYYGPFSKKFIKRNIPISERIKQIKFLGRFVLRLFYLIGIRENHPKKLKKSFSQIDFFCSLLPSDFSYFRLKTGNQNACHLPFSYLSLEDIMEGETNLKSIGNKVMIGHSASPSGNHYEIITLLHQLDSNLSVFLPLAYGEEKYGNQIALEAIKKFPNAEILKEKMEKAAYYKKLTEIGWCIINVKVQQALGNIIALVLIGVKIFLDKDSSTYKDFKKWGLAIFSIQNDLNLNELRKKLSKEQAESNKKIIWQKCNEEIVKQYWENILY